MMNNVKSKLDKFLCTGCSVCFNVCPNGAITMQENNEGFKEPVVDEERCTNCGLCAKVCPVLNPKYENNKKPDCYAFMASDEIRINSASGGVFPVLAYDFIKSGGYVAGAVWDNDWTVKHIVSNKMEDIEKMRSSKYLQSNINSCYKEIKNILTDNKKVLFTGTPCQVAGLKSFLMKNYDNLYCVDIICHGTPSPKVFKKYLEENYKTDNIKSINLRSKRSGWSCGKPSIIIETDSKVDSYTKQNVFWQLFSKLLSIRQSCGECKFAILPRQGDLTMGDFWGIKEKYDDKKGTSIILVNNKRGNHLLNILKKNAILCKKRKLESGIRSNQNIIKPSTINKKRESFFKNLDKMNLKENLEMLFSNKCDCMIINYWYATNYGASLTCLGVQSLIEKLGKTAKIINYTPYFSKNLIYEKGFAKVFADKYLHLTTPCKNYADFEQLNKACETFITGSDQVFAPYIMHSMHDGMAESVYLLDFAKKDKRRIAYAASMGDFLQHANWYDYKLFEHFLPQFEGISVRESDGVEILKDNFNVDSTQLIDGAFHIAKETFEQMTKEYPKKERYVGFYRTPYRVNKWEYETAKKVSEKLKLPLKEFVLSLDKTVDEWVSFIKNADFVLSASYHAIIVSIIFNVPFLKLTGNVPQNRFETLFSNLEIEDNSVNQFSEFDAERIFIPRDWNKINSNIEKERLRAEKWMENIMNQPIKDKDKYDKENTLYINLQLKSNENTKINNLLAKASLELRKYRYYKIMSFLTFGKKKEHYKQKVIELKSVRKELKSMARKYRYKE